MKSLAFITAALLLSSVPIVSATTVSTTTHSVPIQETVKLNQTVNIELPANPTTGYTWVIRQLPNEVALLALDYQQSANCKKDMTGCNGKTVIRLMGIKKGDGDLLVQYARPFEQLPQDAQHIKIIVTE